MARTFNNIRQEIYSEFLASTDLQSMYGFDPAFPFEAQFSKLSLEYNIIKVVAVAIWTFEQILGVSTSQMSAQIKAQKVHSTSWYSDVAKAFQLGHTLPFGEVEYEVKDEDAKIVKYCSCTKTLGGLMVKIAKDGSSSLEPLTVVEFTAFKAYMDQVKGAGDLLFYTNAVADELKLEATIYYDALVLDAAGERLDGASTTPVQDAIDSYLEQMDFNGRFVPTLLVDALQLVEGVVIPELTAVETRYASLPYSVVPANGVIPSAGYLRATSVTLNFVPWEQ